MTQLYYIQHMKQYAYDFILWWGPNHSGYYYDLDQAGTYTKEEADKIVALRGEEVAWPVDLVRASVSSAVSICDLRRTHEKDEFKSYERLAPPPKPYVPPEVNDSDDDKARREQEFISSFVSICEPLKKYTAEYAEITEDDLDWMSDNDEEYEVDPSFDLSPYRFRQLMNADDSTESNAVVEKIPHHLDTKRVGELLDEGRVLREAFEKRIEPMKKWPRE